MSTERPVLKLDPEAIPTEPKSAATVIVVRDRPRSGLEIFFVRRHAKSAFLGGAVVFPGGKLDAADRGASIIAQCVGTPRRATDFAADAINARELGVCACRELLEEAALALTTTPIDDQHCEALRAALTSGRPFGDLLTEAKLSLQLDALHAFGRWVTPNAESRRYDARFFLACAPVGQTGKHDDHETTSSVWATPQKMLEASAAGEVFLAPPTTRCLELLAPAKNIEDAVAIAATQILQPVCPEFVASDPPMLVLPGDPSHSIRETRVNGPSRFVLREGRFCSEDPRD